MHLRLQVLLPALFLAAGFSAFATFALSGSAIAAPDPTYTVSGIHVDATAASSSEALSIAIAQGRPKAWETLFRRLTQQKDWSRQPQYDPQQLLHLSIGFVIANERRSTTRYVADVTYEFNPDAVAKVLREANIAYAQVSSKRILVIPMQPNYTHGAWALALASPRFRNAVVPFAVPAGSASDDATLGGLNFDTANWQDVAPIANRIRATEAVLAQVVYNNHKATINLRRIGLGQVAMKSTFDIPIAQNLPGTFPSAADAVVHGIEDMWKQKASVDYSKQGRLTADVRATSLTQWGTIQTSLAGVSNITSMTVIAMDIGEARVAIAYLGTTDQLKDAMGPQGLALVNKGGEWSISPAPVTQPAPAPATPAPAGAK